MVYTSTTLLVAAVALVSCATTHVAAHGYMYIPLAEFVDSTTSKWVVQIEPQWDGDWDGDDDARVATYVALKAEKNVSDIRSFMDDTTIYGAACGYTDPDATPKEIPSTATATLSRGIVHAGPCEIWLDDVKVMTNDDCQAAYGGDQDVKSVFPVDYSSCSSSGCMLRFYWLALQGIDGETVWQVYKDCVPLAGGSGTSSSTTTTTTSSSAASSTGSSASTEAEASTAESSVASTTESTEASASSASSAETSESAASSAAAEASASSSEYSTSTTESATGSSAEAEETETPVATSATPAETTATPTSSSDKCNVRARK